MIAEFNIVYSVRIQMSCEEGMRQMQSDE